MSTELIVKERDNSRNSITKDLRNKGQIPAIVYGKSIGNRGVSVDERDMIRIFHDSGRNGVIDLQLDGQAISVMVQDMQIDPLKNQILHIDFLEVDMKVEKEAVVPIHLVGESAGQKEGGVVQQLVNEVNVRALPANIPQALEIDISELNIGDVLKVQDIKEKQEYEILDEEEEVIISVTPPTLEPDANPEDETSEDSTKDDVEVQPVGEGQEE